MKRNVKHCFAFLLLYAGMLGGLPVLFSQTQGNPLQNTGPAQTPSFLVELKARAFTPDPNNKLSAVPTSPAQHYVMVQFTSKVDADLLAKGGLPCLGRIDDYTVMTRVPGGFSFANVPELRYAGKLAAIDRVAPALRSELDNSKGGNLYVLVSLLEAFSAAEKAAILQAVGCTEQAHPSISGKEMLVSGSAAALELLALDERLAWMETATDEMIKGEPYYTCPHGTHAEPCDNVPFAKTGKGSTGPLKFETQGDGWDGPGQGCASLTYHFLNNTPDIGGTPEWDAIEAAIAEWARFVAVDFTETATPFLPNSLDFSWETGLHGVLMNHGFPSSRGLIGADADSPADIEDSPIAAGDVHFNEVERWYIWDGNSIPEANRLDVQTIALHEIGHALGLGHSENRDAVMFRRISRREISRWLHPDDVAGIKELYFGDDWEHDWIRQDGSLSTFGVDGDIEVAPNGQVRYRTPNGRMMNAYFSGGTWHRAHIAANWTTNVENIKAGGDIAIDPVSGQTYYHGEDNKLQNMYWSGGQWHHGWVDPDWSDSQWDVAGEIEVAPNGQVFYRASNGLLVNKAWNANTGWTTSYVDPSPFSNAIKVKAGGAIAISPGGQIFYHAENNNIQTYRWENNAWVHGFTIPYATFSLVQGDIEVAANGTVFYEATNNKLQALIWNGSSWDHRRITPLNSNFWDVAGDIDVDPNGQVRHRMNNGRIANVYRGPNLWRHGILEPMWGAETWNLVAGGAMSIGPNGHTFYNGEDGRLQRYRWVGPCMQKTTSGHGLAEVAPAGENMAARLTASPNPFTGQLKLQLDLPVDQEVALEVLDMQGRVVAQPLMPAKQGAGKYEFHLDTHNFPAGMYFARLHCGNSRQTTKLIKVNP